MAKVFLELLGQQFCYCYLYKRNFKEPAIFSGSFLLFTKIFKSRPPPSEGLYDLKQPNSSLAKIPILMYLCANEPNQIRCPLYKSFSPISAMIEALMRDFVPTSLVEEIDFSTLAPPAQ